MKNVNSYFLDDSVILAGHSRILHYLTLPEQSRQKGARKSNNTMLTKGQSAKK